MANPITVRIPHSLYQRSHNEIIMNVAVIKKLREAGVPVIGHVSIQGAERGHLSIHGDTMNGDTVFTYTPNNPAPKQPAKRNFDDEDDEL